MPSSKKINWFRISLPIVVLLVMIYPVLRVLDWYGIQVSTHPVTWLGSWLAITLLVRRSFAGSAGLSRSVVVHWLGIGFVCLWPVLAYEIIRSIFDMDDQISATVVGTFVLLIIGYSMLAAHFFKIRKIKISSKKLGDNVRVVQLSDVHIGSRSRLFLQRIVRRVNRLNPDIVVITGDLLDTRAVDLEMLRPLADISADCYFVTGNHERYIDLERICDDLAIHGLHVLRNRRVDAGGVEIIGIDDAENPKQVALHLPNMPALTEKFQILLYHKPEGWSDAIAAGIDLKLSGHTHNGQVFPFNYLVKRQFPLIKGLYRRNQHHLYVSPGTGTWGPMMRLGSFNEISCIDLLRH